MSNEYGEDDVEDLRKQVVDLEARIVALNHGVDPAALEICRRAILRALYGDSGGSSAGVELRWALGSIIPGWKAETEMMTPQPGSIVDLETRLKNVAAVARKATLPSTYQWGEDAMEAFNFGKECAAREIEAGGVTSGDYRDDRIRDLEERVAHAEIARDNALAMRDEAQHTKKQAGESASRRIEALINLARKYAKEPYLHHATERCEKDLAAILSKDAPPKPTKHEPVYDENNTRLGSKDYATPNTFPLFQGKPEPNPVDAFIANALSSTHDMQTSVRISSLLKERIHILGDQLGLTESQMMRGLLDSGVKILADRHEPVAITASVSGDDPAMVAEVAETIRRVAGPSAVVDYLRPPNNQITPEFRAALRKTLEAAMYSFIAVRNGTPMVEDQYEVTWHFERLDNPSLMNSPKPHEVAEHTMKQAKMAVTRLAFALKNNMSIEDVVIGDDGEPKYKPFTKEEMAKMMPAFQSWVDASESPPTTVETCPACNLDIDVCDCFVCGGCDTRTPESGGRYLEKARMWLCKKCNEGAFAKSSRS